MVDVALECCTRYTFPIEKIKAHAACDYKKYSMFKCEKKMKIYHHQNIFLNKDYFTALNFSPSYEYVNFVNILEDVYENVSNNVRGVFYECVPWAVQYFKGSLCRPQ